MSLNIKKVFKSQKNTIFLAISINMVRFLKFIVLIYYFKNGLIFFLILSLIHARLDILREIKVEHDAYFLMTKSLQTSGTKTSIR